MTYAHARAGRHQGDPRPRDRLPKVTNGGKTYTFTLRKGLKFSDGTPGQGVRLPDHRPAAVQGRLGRGAVLQRPSSAPTDFQSGKADTISGIKTNDRTGEIVINLTEPNGSFHQRARDPFTAIVPPDTPDKDQTPNPPPSTGPYEISSSNSGHELDALAQPAVGEEQRQDHAAICPLRHLDKITEKVVPNQSSGTAQVEQNKADLLYDPPPTDRSARCRRSTATGSSRGTVSTYYFWMNTAKTTAGGVPNPFSDLKVRQAVNYAVDPTAIEKLYGGLLTPTQQVLPPNMAGYKKIELYPHNLNKAKQLIAQANLPSSRRTSPSGLTTSSQLERRPVLPERAPEARLQREAERRERRDLLHDARQPEDAGPQHRMVRLVSRTSPTPTTSSSRC